MYIGICIYNRVSNLLCLSDLFFLLSVLSKTRANPAEPRPTPPIVPPTSNAHHHHDDEHMRRCRVAAAASVFSQYTTPNGG